MLHTKNIIINNHFLLSFLFFFLIFDYGYIASFRHFFPGVPDLPVLIRTFLVVCFLYLYYRNRIRIFRRDLPVVAVFLILCVGYIVRVGYDISSSISFNIFTESYYLLISFSTLILPFPIAFIMRHHDPKQFLRHACYINCVLCMLTAYYLFIEFQSGSLNIINGRVSADFINSITIGYIGGISVMTAVLCFFKSNINKLFTFWLLVLGLTLLFIGASRSQFLFVSYVASLVMIGRLRRSPFLILGTVLLITLFVSFFGEYEAGIFARLDLNDSVRIDLYRSAFALINQSPWFGHGIEPLVLFAHNVFLEAFLINGFLFGSLLSLLCFVAFMYCSFRLIFRIDDYTFFDILYLGAFFINFFSGLYLFSGALFACLFCLMTLDRGRSIANS